MKKRIIPLLVLLLTLSMFLMCGPSGDSGNSGDAGNSGDSGDAGNTGDSGDAGNTGDSGDAGNTGDSGDAGNTGDSGDAGNTGDSGDAGNTGDSGDAGNSGDSGDAGNTGDSGDAGNTGDSGDAGSTVQYTLTIAKMGNGSVTPSEGDHTYDDGTSVDLSATADEGWYFVKWDGQVENATSASTSVTIDSDKTVTAVFEENIRITFEDANLEQVVRDAISKPTGDIYAGDVSGITEIFAREKGIASLVGIEHLANLTTLSLSENQLTEVSLNGLTTEIHLPR